MVIWSLRYASSLPDASQNINATSVNKSLLVRFSKARVYETATLKNVATAPPFPSVFLPLYPRESPIHSDETPQPESLTDTPLFPDTA